MDLGIIDVLLYTIYAVRMETCRIVLWTQLSGQRMLLEIRGLEIAQGDGKGWIWHVLHPINAMIRVGSVWLLLAAFVWGFWGLEQWLALSRKKQRCGDEESVRVVSTDSSVYNICTRCSALVTCYRVYDKMEAKLDQLYQLHIQQKVLE